MKKYDDSVALASALVRIGSSAGKKTMGFITDMNQPLGHAVGNWLEVRESVECLRGRNIADLMGVTYVLGGAMLYLGGKAASIEEGMRQCKAAIHSGRAYEKFLQLVKRQGGDISVVENLARPQRGASFEVVSDRAGFIGGFDTHRIGVLSVELGAGRMRVNDRVDHTAGLLVHKKVGDRVEKGEPLATGFTARTGFVDEARSVLADSIHYAESPVRPPSLIRGLVEVDGVKPWVPPSLY
jgi:pyrimidine-nucleoside phosphorylase